MSFKSVYGVIQVKTIDKIDDSLTIHAYLKKTNHGFMARGFRMGFKAMRDDGKHRNVSVIFLHTGKVENMQLLMESGCRHSIEFSFDGFVLHSDSI